MWRAFWCGLAAATTLAGLGVWASVNATFLYKHPTAPSARIVVDSQTGAAIVMGRKSGDTPSAGQGVPQAVAEAVEHDFGTLDPLTRGRHQFTIHNRGTAPLKLQVGPTTCKCTVSGLADREVAPGHSTTVTLEWNTGRHLHYAHSATFYTNDPARKAIEFRVTGKVRMLVGLDQPELTLGTIDPTQSTQVERLLYSQLWSDFDLIDIQSRTEGLAWEIERLEPADAPELEAMAVQRLRITLPGGLPSGRIEDVLRLTVRPREGEPQQVDLPLLATVPRRIALYGQAIDDDGVIDLGDVREGESRSVTLLVKVRDADPQLPAVRVTAFPAFLRPTLEPQAPEKGLYRLRLELPDDAPICQFRSQPLGRLTLETGHARVGSVELKVTFAVLPRRSL